MAQTFKQLGVFAGIVSITAFGIATQGWLTGTLAGLLAAALLVLGPELGAKVDVVRADLAPRTLPGVALVVARLSGPLTFLARGTLLRLLGDTPSPRYVALDMTSVSFIDGGGVSEIESLLDFLEIRSGNVIIVGCRPAVRLALVRAGLVRRLAGQRVFGTLEGSIDTLALAGASPANRFDLAVPALV